MSKRFLGALAALSLAPLAHAQTPADERVDAAEGKIAALEEQLAEMKGAVEKLSRLKFSGYVQPRYEVNEAYNPKAPGSAPGIAAPVTANEGFSIRRGRLKAEYDAKTSEYVLQIDATPSGVSLKSAEAILKLPWVNGYVLAGQTEWPFGYETQASSADLALLERSRVVGAFLPAEYDRGVKAYARGGVFNAKFGLFNGIGTQTYTGYILPDGRTVTVNPTGGTAFDNDRKKDFVGRVGMDLGWLVAGVSGWYGKYDLPGVAATSSAPAVASSTHERTRLGADAQLYLDLLPLGGTSVKGEFITGKSPFASGKDVVDVSAHGWYVQLQQFVTPRIELVGRYEQYDPKNGKDDVASSGKYASTATNQTNVFAYGAHWYVDGNLKLSAIHELPVTRTVGTNRDPPDQLLRIQLQAKF